MSVKPGTGPEHPRNPLRPEPTCPRTPRNTPLTGRTPPGTPLMTKIKDQLKKDDIRYLASEKKVLCLKYCFSRTCE